FSKEKNIKDCDLVIFNRLPSFSMKLLLNLKRIHGFKYIVDVDDYWFLNENHYLYDIHQKKLTAQKIIQAITSADAVTVTNSLLADKVKSINKNVHIIPNALPLTTPYIPNYNYKTRFVYAGGHSHVNDVKIIKDVLYKSNIDLTLAGFNPNK